MWHRFSTGGIDGAFNEQLTTMVKHHGMHVQVGGLLFAEMPT